MKNVKEDIDNVVNLNPNMNVQGMGDVTNTSGDVAFCIGCDDDEKSKKRKKKLTYLKNIDDFVKATK